MMHTMSAQTTYQLHMF